MPTKGASETAVVAEQERAMVLLLRWMSNDHMKQATASDPSKSKHV
jgi:hypothetical protein